MDTSSPGNENLGPIQLIYFGAEQIFNATQGTVHFEKVSDFVETVRWSEPFIQGLLAFQGLLFLVTYLTRKRDFMQFGILFVVTMIALGAERLNGYGKDHWRSFATQDYFDKSGLFMMVFVSGPFVFLANFIVIGMVTRLAKLYALKRRREIQRHQRENESTQTNRESKKGL